MKNINKRTLALILAVALVLALAGCAATSLNLDELYDDVMALQVSVDEYVASKGVEVEVIEAITLDEEALLPYVQFYDLYAVVQANEVDAEVEADTEVDAEAENEDNAEIETPHVDVVDVYDEDVILDITVDDSDVDATTTGDYDIIYTVTVEIDGLEYEVVITKTIHIVTAEDYEAMVEAGEIAETESGIAISTVVEVSTTDTAGGADIIAVTTGDNGNSADSGDSTQDDDTSNAANSSTGDSADTGDTTTATAKPAATSAPTATEKPSTSGTTTTATATPAPTATAKPSTSTTTATATPKPTTSSGSTTTTHTHSYTSTVTTAATCTTAGVRTYTCSCGASYTESIPATGHNWVTETVSDGYYETVTVTDQAAYDEYIAGYYKCLGCGYTTTSSDDMLLHTLSEGYGYTKVASQTIHHDAVTHTEQQWVDTSYTKTYCSVCGSTQ